uniref:SecA DEAD-like N-terminal domain-containing protein n=1 Tax=Anopheles farauti TaxID=69004 RepID=A0A182Q6M4_9DIPT
MLKKRSAIEEVRFIAGSLLIVDADLATEVWRGRNVVVFASEVKVTCAVCWNVSGNDNSHKYTRNAGTDADGRGKQGSDGYPGESGGNVLIQAKLIECSERWTIVSHGGNGSDGQDGGNGADGADGSPGKSEMSGGTYGLGGQGGFPGEIVFECLEGNKKFEIKKSNDHGSDGANGKGGLSGKHGKNGWDMAYMDSSMSDTKYYGVDRQSKLDVDYYNGSSEDRVYCPYKALTSSYYYVQIKKTPNEHKTHRAEDIEDRREAYSMNQVIYGDLASFQRDYLLDRFYGKHVLGDHQFNNVIVDEVDSMLLDKEMELKLQKIEKKTAAPSEGSTKGANFDAFEKDVVDQWKSMLNQHVGQLIAQNFVAPVLRMGINSAIMFVGQKMKRLTITVHGEKGIKQSFSSGTGGPEIHLDLVDNHFTLTGSESDNSVSRNNCLFGALSEAIPALQLIGANEFRNLISHDIRRPDYHLDSRLSHHTLRFAGELKKISEETNIPLDNLIKAGRSLYKASRASAGPDFHQAHVLRICLNPDLVKDHPELYTLLTNHAGHTQMVEKFVNVFHKIGGDIDKNQASWIIDLASIDYNEGLKSKSNVAKLESYKKSVLNLYDTNINSNKYSDAEKLMLEKAKRIMINTKNEVLFERAQRGYNLSFNYDIVGKELDICSQSTLLEETSSIASLPQTREDFIGQMVTCNSNRTNPSRRLEMLHSSSYWKPSKCT